MNTPQVFYETETEESLPHSFYEASNPKTRQGNNNNNKRELQAIFFNELVAKILNKVMAN
jgi:hypothetical protein